MNTSAKKPFAVALPSMLLSGTTAATLSALALAWRGRVEGVGSWRGLNAVSHWLWGDRALQQTQPSWRFTAPGAIIHYATSMLWATLFERSLIKTSNQSGSSSQLERSGPLESSSQRSANPQYQLTTARRFPQPKINSSPQQTIIKQAAVITTLAWFVDFYLTPKRLTPGFERVVSKRSLLLTYVAFGVGLSACAGAQRGCNAAH